MRLHAIFEQSLSIDGRNMLAQNVCSEIGNPIVSFIFRMKIFGMQIWSLVQFESDSVMDYISEYFQLSVSLARSESSNRRAQKHEKIN